VGDRSHVGVHVSTQNGIEPDNALAGVERLLPWRGDLVTSHEELADRSIPVVMNRRSRCLLKRGCSKLSTFGSGDAMSLLRRKMPYWICEEVQTLQAWRSLRPARSTYVGQELLKLAFVDIDATTDTQEADIILRAGDDLVE
jgi:hypothetical protein